MSEFIKLFQIKLILVEIFTRREVLAVRGEVVGSHGPVELSGPSTLAHSLPTTAVRRAAHHGSPADF